MIQAPAKSASASQIPTISLFGYPDAMRPGRGKGNRDQSKHQVPFEYEKKDAQQKSTSAQKAEEPAPYIKRRCGVEDLAAFVELNGGTLEEGWSADSYESIHSRYKVYSSPTGTKFRSRIEVLKYLGLGSISSKSSKRMTKGTRKSKQVAGKTIAKRRPKGMQTTGRENVSEDLSAPLNPANQTVMEFYPDISEQHISPNNADQSVDIAMSLPPVDPAMAPEMCQENPESLKLGVTAVSDGIHAALDGPLSLQIARNGSVPAALVTQRCQDVLRGIISAEKFGALTRILNQGLISGSLETMFPTKVSMSISDALGFHLISLRLSLGAYGHIPEMFSTDIQQVWKNIDMVGNELISLSKALAELSSDLFKKQVLSLFQVEPETPLSPVSASLSERQQRIPQTEKVEISPQPLSKGAPKLTKNQSSRVLTKRGKTVMLTSEQHNEAMKENSAKFSGKAVCVKCGQEDSNVLLCDICDAAYHMNCLDMPVESIPDDWYCPPCVETGKKGAAEATVNEDNEAENDHHCAVCARINSNASKAPLVDSAAPPNELADEDFLEHCSKTIDDAFLLKEEGACKLCGVKGSKIIFDCSGCGKWYHLSCLKPPLKKVPRKIWYCPSCLCRTCKVDADDDKILLCDGCDEGYHIYCLKPPLMDIPEGPWFCSSCEDLRLPADFNIPLAKGSSKRKRKISEPKRSI